MICEPHHRAVDPEWIKQQRRDGWPDVAPRTIVTGAGRVTQTGPSGHGQCGLKRHWNGQPGICCLNCFTEMHEAASGGRTLWTLVPYTKAIGREWDVD